MISANHPHLPPGTVVMEKDPVTGQLVPTRKILTADPPRPLHVNAKREIVDVTRQGVDYMKEEAEKHYELKRRVKGEGVRVPTATELRNLAERAAEQIMGSAT